jgi:hypothetical protein
MSNSELEILKQGIKRAIQLSADKLLSKKKLLGQELVISENGEIKVIRP